MTPPCGSSRFGMAGLSKRLIDLHLLEQMKKPAVIPSDYCRPFKLRS